MRLIEISAPLEVEVAVDQLNNEANVLLVASQTNSVTLIPMKIEVDFNFTPLSAVELCKAGDVIDIKGWVANIHQLNRRIRNNATRQIEIVDEEMKIVTCTLWNDRAENYVFEKYDSIAVKYAKVNTYNIKNVGLLDSTPIIVNCPSIGNIRQEDIEFWYRNGQFVR